MFNSIVSVYISFVNVSLTLHTGHLEFAAFFFGSAKASQASHLVLGNAKLDYRASNKMLDPRTQKLEKVR